jgi:hypothetical protein
MAPPRETSDDLFILCDTLIARCVDWCGEVFDHHHG